MNHSRSLPLSTLVVVVGLIGHLWLSCGGGSGAIDPASNAPAATAVIQPMAHAMPVAGAKAMAPAIPAGHNTMFAGHQMGAGCVAGPALVGVSFLALLAWWPVTTPVRRLPRPAPPRSRWSPVAAHVISLT